MMKKQQRQKIKQKDLPVIKFPFCCPPHKIAAYFIRKIFLSANNKKNCRTHTLYRRASIAIFRLSCLRFTKLSLFLCLSSAIHQSKMANTKHIVCTISYHTHARAHTHTRGMRRYFDEYKQVLIGLAEWHNTRFASTQNEKGEFSIHRVFIARPM